MWDDGHVPESYQDLRRQIAAEPKVVFRSFRRSSQEPFNYAAKVNHMCASADTESIIILNDDMVVQTADWIQSLLTYSIHPEIGVVGGRLIHEDNTVQHVGCVLGVHGSSTHPYHGYSADHVGYNGFTHITRNYSVVTGACMAMRKEVFEMVGGFDEIFKTDFNDTDFCLKVRKRGLRVVYNPHVQFIHYESKSCVRTSQSPEEVMEFKRRWSDMISNDPYYHPCLSRNSGDFSLAQAHLDLITVRQ